MVPRLFLFFEFCVFNVILDIIQNTFQVFNGVIFVINHLSY